MQHQSMALEIPQLSICDITEFAIIIIYMWILENDSKSHVLFSYKIIKKIEFKKESRDRNKK